MQKATKIGFSFGLTSATITTLGLIIGLDASTGSQMVVATGILTIAVADAFSDALGVHVAKEAEGNFSQKEVWRATLYTFLSKFIFALTFLFPILLLASPWSLVVAILWGLIILIILNYYIARDSGKKVGPIIFEHLFVAVIVIFFSRLAGLAIERLLT